VVREVVVGDEVAVEVVVEVEVGSGTSVDAVAPGPVVCVASVALEVLLPVELPPSSPPQALATRDIASIVARESSMVEFSAAMVPESPLRQREGVNARGRVRAASRPRRSQPGRLRAARAGA
jgi:hypothetical protein